MNIPRRRFVRAGSGVLLTVSAPALRAQGDWPARPVRLVSPYGAGGSNDVSARIIGEELAQRLKQPFVVENKPGAGTRLANDLVAHAAPDGYTFLYAAAPFATVQAMYDKLTYDPRKDFQAVMLCTVAPVFLIVNAQAPFRDLKSLIAYGKAKPEGLTFASPGAGSGPHLAAELLFRKADVKGLNVHFRGDATAYVELLAGRVDATLTAITTALPHIRSGKLRVLGVASEQRSEIEPDVPTLREQGYDVVGYGWFGLMAPAGTPGAIVERVRTETRAVLAEPAVKKKFLELGLEPRGGTSAQFATFIDAESRKWGEVIRAANIKGD